MPRCACVGGTCNCLIKSGPGATVTGNGTAGNPYIVSADGATNLEIRDTDTIDLTLDGDGTAADPFILRGDAVLALDELTDVDAATPAAGQALVFDSATSTWKPGAVASGGGKLTVQDTPTLDLTLTGDGSVATPYLLLGNVLGGGGGAQTALMKASYVRTGAVAVPSSLATPVLFETALYPAVGIMYNPANGVFTVPTAGLYMVVMTQSWAADAGGSYRQLRLLKNGAIFDNRNLPWPATAPSTYQPIFLARTIQLAAGDQISMNAYSGSQATSLYVDPTKTFTAMEVYSLDTSPPLSTAAPGRDITGWTLQDSTIVGTLALAHPYQVDRHVVWNFTATVNLPFVTTANGQLTPALQIATITDVAARPRTNTTISWSNGSTLWGMGIINTDGTVVLQTCNRLSLNAAAGQAVRINASWITSTSPVPVSPPLVTSVWGQGDLTPANVGTDSTVGGYTYIDANGQLRTLPKPIFGMVAPYTTGNFIDTTKGSGSGTPWTISANSVRMLRYGPIVQMYWNMSPASDLTSSTTGNISNIIVGQLANGAPPPLMAGNMTHGTFSGGGSVPVGGVSTSGNVTLGVMNPVSVGTYGNWPAGEGRDFGLVYVTAIDSP